MNPDVQSASLTKGTTLEWTITDGLNVQLALVKPADSEHFETSTFPLGVWRLDVLQASLKVIADRHAEREVRKSLSPVRTKEGLST